MISELIGEKLRYKTGVKMAMGRKAWKRIAE
jgi:hypothetical protein